jgi:hypothetical protein
MSDTNGTMRATEKKSAAQNIVWQLDYRRMESKVYKW